MEKKRKIISYENLPSELQDKLRKKYPNGFAGHTHRIDTPKESMTVINLETPDSIYMVKVRVSDKKSKSMDDDDDESFTDDEFAVPDAGNTDFEADKDEFKEEEEDDNAYDQPEEYDDDEDEGTDAGANGSDDDNDDI